MDTNTHRPSSRFLIACILLIAAVLAGTFSMSASASATRAGTAST